MRAHDIDVESRPSDITSTKLGMVHSHVLGAYSLGIDTIEQGDGATREYTRRDITRLGRLLGGL